MRFRRRRGTGALVLMYHRVCELADDPFLLAVQPARFAEHLELLRRHWHPIGLTDAMRRLRKGTLPRRAVVVTFDDGYADNLHVAAPLLERHKVPATMFVTSGHVGADREFWWDELERIFLSPGTLPAELSLTIDGEAREWPLGDAAVYSVEDHARLRTWDVLDPNDPGPRQATCRSLLVALRGLPPARRDELLGEIRAWSGAHPGARPTHRALSPEEARRLAASPTIEVGGHTISHPLLSACTVEEQEAEISGGREQLQQLVGVPVKSFAYPFGTAADYTPDTIELVRGAGFETACSNFEGVLTGGTDPLQIPRLMVLPHWPADELDRRLALMAAS
jgi:peptidoglycan/xylan/chitin deacetylase (PgdA/CDA1 family)